MSDSIPLWRRAREAILDRIVAGDYGAGAMLPSETELGAELGVSQGTARKALAELERSGVVERRQGRGTFVAVTTPERALFHFFRLRRPDGTRVTPELKRESLRRRRASPRERAVFGEGAVFEIARLRCVEGRPLVREKLTLPVALFPGLTERAPLPNTLYAFYQRVYGIAVTQAEEALSAAAAEGPDIDALGVTEGAPLLQVERRALDISDRVVELRLSRYRTDGLRYAVKLR